MQCFKHFVQSVSWMFRFVAFTFLYIYIISSLSFLLPPVTHTHPSTHTTPRLPCWHALVTLCLSTYAFQALSYRRLDFESTIVPDDHPKYTCLKKNMVRQQRIAKEDYDYKICWVLALFPGKKIPGDLRQVIALLP